MQQLQDGRITSLPKAKDVATTHWRNHSATYDAKRAVQLPSTHPGTGHQAKRIHTEEETQYQYRKQIISGKEVTDTDTNVATEKADRALEVKRIMRDIMRLSKEELRREISSRQDSMEELQEEPPKTIENMQLSLLAVEVYERL